jgi:hypothetical protein
MKLGLLLLLLFVLQACHTHAGYVLDQVRQPQQRKSFAALVDNCEDMAHTSRFKHAQARAACWLCC